MPPAEKTLTYAESPLKQIVTDVLGKITALKQKYPAGKGTSDSLEKKHALKLINCVETILTMLDKSIFPEFNDYKKPNLVTLVVTNPGLFQLKNQRSEFFSRKHTLYLDVIKELPSIVKNTKTNNAEALTQNIFNMLDKNKESLFKNAKNIPGEPLDDLFHKMKEIIREKNNHSADINTPKHTDILIETLQKKFFASTEELRPILTIAHPITYELAELLIDLIPKLPVELKKLVPFLNPEALSENLFGYGISKEQNDETPESAFVYNITRNIDGKEQVIEHIDCAEKYLFFRNFYQRHMISEMQSFCSKNAENPFVKKQLAYSTLLQQLIKAECDSIEQTNASNIDAPNSAIEFNQNNPLELMQAIDTEIGKDKLLITQNNSLQEDLKAKAVYYASIPISDLISKHPNLDQESGFDISYTSMPLPEQIIGAELVPIKKSLITFIDSQLSLLQKTNKVLQTRIDAQTNYLSTVFAAWQNETIEINHEKTKQQLSLLDSCNQSLEQINNSDKKIEADLNDIDVLREAIALKNLLYSKRSEIQKQLITLLQDTENDATRIPAVKQLDTNQIIQNFNTEQNTSIIKKTQALLSQLEQKQAEQLKEIGDLHYRMGKAQSEAQFAEIMKTADPEQLSDLLEKAKNAVTKYQEDQNQLQSSANRNFDSYFEQERSLEKLHSKTSEIIKKFKEINKKNQDLVKKLMDIAVKYNLLQPLPREEDLVHSPNDFINFADTLNDEIFKLYETLEKARPGRLYQQNTRLLMSEVNTCLLKSQDKNSIPFKEIENLAILINMNKAKKLTGFNFFLSTIALDKDIDEWKNYRERQEHPLKRSHSKDYLSKMFDLLITNIEKTNKFYKISAEELEKQEQDECTYQTILTNQPVIREITNDFNSNFNARTALGKEFNDHMSEVEKCSGLIKQQKNEYQEQMNRLKLLEHEKKQVQGDVYLLSKIIRIFNGIRSLEEHVKYFDDSNEQLFSNDFLYLEITDLKNFHQRLVNEIKQVITFSAKLTKADVYKNNIDTINQLLESMQQNLTKIIQRKINLSPLHKQRDEYRSCLDGLDKGRTQLIANKKSLASIDDLQQFKTLVTDYSNLFTLIVQQRAEIEKLKANAATINEEQTNTKVEEVRLSNNILQQDACKLGDLLMDDLISILENINSESNVFKDHDIHQESVEIQNSAAKKLVLFKEQLSKLPDFQNTEIPHTEKRKLNDIKLLGLSIVHRLKHSESANEQLLARINEREKLVNTVLIPKLDTYWAKREHLYVIKDTFSPADKNNRQIFIKHLKKQLENYCLSGDSKQVLATIADTRRPESTNKFSGINLQAILNKITVEIKDLDRKIPPNYNIEIPEQDDEDNLHKQAISLLKFKEKTKPNYVTAINELYKQIDIMEHQWNEEKTVSLTKKLRNDIDRFVLNHPENLPNIDEYKQFKQDFTMRLHSEDDMMSKHSKSEALKLTGINLVIGLCTLGFALGFKLIHSKLSDGHCSLFFSKTNRQKQIASIEESLPPLAPSA